MAEAVQRAQLPNGAFCPRWRDEVVRAPWYREIGHQASQPEGTAEKSDSLSEERPDQEYETLELVDVTGHDLEWLLMLPAEWQPDPLVFERAANYLAAALAAAKDRDLRYEYCPFSHAARSLRLLGRASAGSDTPSSRLSRWGGSQVGRFCTAMAVMFLGAAGSAAPAESSPPESRDEIWQMERESCGVNSAYLFLKLHDYQADYQALAKELPGGETESSLKDIQDCLRKQGFPAMVVQSDLKHLSESRLPAIAHLEMDSTGQFLRADRSYYVVLLGFTEKNRVEYLDGSSGMIEKMPMPDFFRCWSGYLILPDEGALPLVAILLTAIYLAIVVGCWWFFRWHRAVRMTERPSSGTAGC